jgi:protein ImuB
VEAVVRARLRAAHLPEASFCWESVDEPRFPRPRSPNDDTLAVSANDPHDVEPLPLCRAIHERPRPLPTPRRFEPDGWQLAPDLGAVVALHGPFRISGGWWARTVERDYYYAQTQRGDLLWVFYDRPRRRWFLHGEIG